MNSKLLKLLLIAFLFSWKPADAQRIALKTNTLDWVLMSPNLSLETRLSNRITLDVGMSGNLLSWSPYGSDVKLRNFRVEPELRYWFNRPMARHFVGIGLMGGPFDLQFRSHCYKGNIVAAVVNYGYALVLNRHWNVEFTVGVGLGRTWGYDYRSYEEQLPKEKNMNKWIPVPMGTSVSFSYIFD